MPELPPPERPRTSRQRYRRFVEDYRHRRLDDLTDEARGIKSRSDGGKEEQKQKRREMLREYIRWLRPHAPRVILVFALAIGVAAVQLI